VDVIMKITIVALGCAAGPVGLAMAIMYVSKPSLQQDVMKAVTNGCEAMFGQRAGELIGSAVNLVVADMLSGGNPMLMLSLVCGQDGPVQTFVAGCGGSDEDQAIAAAVVQGVVMIAVTIAIAIVTFGAGSELVGAAAVATAAEVTTAAAEATTAAAEVTAVAAEATAEAAEATVTTAETAVTTAEVAETTTTATETTVTTAETSQTANEVAETTDEVANVADKVASTADKFKNIIDRLQIAFQVITSSLTMAQQGVEINNDILMSQIVMIKARAEAQAEQVAAMIQILTQIINKLLDLMNGNASTLVNLGEFQSDKYTQASQITSQIF